MGAGCPDPAPWRNRPLHHGNGSYYLGKMYELGVFFKVAFQGPTFSIIQYNTEAIPQLLPRSNERAHFSESYGAEGSSTAGAGNRYV